MCQIKYIWKRGIPIRGKVTLVEVICGDFRKSRELNGVKRPVIEACSEEF